MRNRRAYKVLTLLLIFIFTTAVGVIDSRAAIWGGSEKASKLDKDSYEKLVKKNLEFREQLDSMMKEQEQLRDIYKVLLEKVKTFQRENASLEKTLAESQKRVDEQAKKLKAQEKQIEALEKEPGKAGKGTKTRKADEPAGPQKLTRNDVEPYSPPDPDMVKEYESSSAVGHVKEAIRKADTELNTKKAKAAILQKDLGKAAADKKKLRDSVETARAVIKASKEEIDTVNAEAGQMNEETAAEEGRIKILRESLSKASSEQRDAEAAILDAEKNVTQTEESIKKLKPEAQKDPAAQAGLQLKNEELTKAHAAEAELKIKVRSAEDDVKNFGSEIESAQARLKKELAAKAASEKENLKNLEKRIADSGAQETAADKGLQHLVKKISSLERKRNELLVEIKVDDTKISDLKRIIAKQVMQIKVAEGYSGPAETQPDGSKTELSALTKEIDALKEQNKELEKELLCARQDMKKALRKAALDKKLPEEMAAKIKKERLDMHYNLAVVYDMGGLYEDAKREYLKCLKIDPKDAGVHYNLGILYDDKLNNNRKAEYHYRQFLRYRSMGDDAMQVRKWLTSIELEERLGKEAR